MPSPHEVSTLMLVRCGQALATLDRMDLETLLELRPSRVETLQSGHRPPCITTSGHAVLDAIAQTR